MSIPESSAEEVHKKNNVEAVGASMIKCLDKISIPSRFPASAYAAYAVCLQLSNMGVREINPCFFTDAEI